jgi:hypothetical protein
MSEWVTGRALFEVVADRSGRVRSARLVDATRDMTGWQRYGEKLLSTPLRGMRLPESARGVVSLLDVSAENELSSGHRYWWSPGVALSFDIADASARRARTVQARALNEVWF